MKLYLVYEMTGLGGLETVGVVDEMKNVIFLAQYRDLFDSER